jgi:N-acetylglucosamine kinase-like BadF-type ATPase
MILIADSGSTKCDWVAIQKSGEEVLRTLTMGFNPYFHSQATISTAIKQNEQLSSLQNEVEAIYYYGAGCSSKELNHIVEVALRVSFPNAMVYVDHDLLGAAYAAYQGEPNVTCILGTGSNSCLFDGESLTESVPALGFILGDEGSGSYFGKKLIAAHLYGNLPTDVNEDFKRIYGLTMQEIVTNVYVKPHANVYLASFVRFISGYKNLPFFKEMLHNGMKEFLATHVLCYPEAKDLKVNFVGSVAFHFNEAIHSAAQDLGLTIGEIIQRPVDELVNYHKKYILIETIES